MPNKHEKKKHKKKRTRSSDDDSSDGEDVPASLRLIQLAALGDRKHVRRLLKRRPRLVDAADASGCTALHEACRHGHMDVVRQLLKYGADANARNHAGDTPAHLAGARCNLPLLVLLLQAPRPPDVDRPNVAGTSVRHLMEGLMGQTAAAGGSAAPVVAPQRSAALAGGSPRVGPAPLASAQRGGGGAWVEEGAGEEEDWGQRLAEELSDEEVGGIGYARYMPHPQRGAPPAAAWGDDDDEAAWAAAGGGDDDAWAERLWADMQAHRNQLRNQAKAKVYGPPRPSADEAAAARRARADEARAESDRILREERAKDASWREAMMSQIRESGAPAQRDAYMAKWAALAALPPHQQLHYADLPWPLPDASAAGSARGDGAPAPAPLDAQRFRAIMLQGVEGGPAGVRARLRSEVLRWHPDKFEARWGARLAPGDRARVLARVREVAQLLTQLMAGSKAG